MNFGSLARAVVGGGAAAIESRDERERELLIAAQRQRIADAQVRADEARARKEQQDATYEAQDRINKEADRVKKQTADAAEEQRRLGLTTTRVKLLRMRKPYSDPTAFSDQDLQAIASDDTDFKTAMTGGDSGTPKRGTPEYNAMIAQEEDIRGRTRARYREGRQPPHQMTEQEYILKNVPSLMKTTKGRYVGQDTPGMSLEQATEEARRRYRAAMGQAQANAPTAPPRPTAGAGKLETSPRTAGLAPSTQSLLDEAAASYQAALQQPGANKEALREEYNQTVRAIARSARLIK